MNDSYRTFKTFPDAETAHDFSEVLKSSGIPFFVEENALTFDPSYANNPLNKDYGVKILPSDFDRANKALAAYYAAQPDAAEDYYLYQFSSEELKDILKKPDEWGNYDYQLAQKILQSRGVVITDEERESWKTERLRLLAQPEKERSSNVIGYYILGILFSPVGLIIGWIWSRSKKTLPDGRSVYAYEANIRKHGGIIFTIAAILLLLTILAKVFA
ncbi:MAG TPA: hypothetical protein VHK91_08925 [Flavisolibacter sp.]|jgi:hypothetical protein|nr:hypothetical protein [Flavisolibacter sp.]